MAAVPGLSPNGRPSCLRPFEKEETYRFGPMLKRALVGIEGIWDLLILMQKRMVCNNPQHVHDDLTGMFELHPNPLRELPKQRVVNL